MAKKMMYDEMINAKKGSQGSAPSQKAASALLSLEDSMDSAQSGASGFPVGHDPSVGRGQYANLPQEKVMAAYPRTKKSLDGMLDDTISDMDRVANDSEGQRNKYVSYQK